MSSRRATNPTPIPEAPDKALISACSDMLGRTGATALQIRFSEDEQPVVWMAVAEYTKSGGTQFEAAGGMDPKAALLRLLALVMDGGTCTHCRRPSAVTQEHDQQLLADRICWYQYDPELKTFRRGCA